MSTSGTKRKAPVEGDEEDLGRGLERPDGDTEGSNEEHAARGVSEEVAALKASCKSTLETLKLPLTENDKVIQKVASGVVNNLRVYDLILMLRKHCIQAQKQYREMKDNCDEISNLYILAARETQRTISHAILTSETSEVTTQTAHSEPIGPSETPDAPSTSATFEGALPMAAEQGQISAATAELKRIQILDFLSMMEVHFEKLREHLRRL